LIEQLFQLIEVLIDF